jgi:transcriptional regulator with PAS, ATPase and Fis domain
MVGRAIAQRRMLTEYFILKEELAERRGAPRIIGEDAKLRQVSQQLHRAAATDATVLLEGESGTGKELFARALHALSPRADGPFVAINCAAIPETLLETELFGHEKGAFTGAAQRKPGRFEIAHRGTLFLDEIGDLPLPLQAKILRVLEEKQFERVGGTQSLHVDVRIVAATNRQLHAEVEAGRFRLDLLYRLDVVRITLPPLRERREDIALLAEHIWRDATERVGSRAALSAATIAALARYDWPGNVRELQNVLAALAVRTPKRGVVPPTALPPAFCGRRDESWRLDAARRVFDEQFIRAALVRSGGHRSRAADELGVSRQGLTKLMARLGIASNESNATSEAE